MPQPGQTLTFNWTISQSNLVKLQIPVIDSFKQPFDVTGWTVDAKIKDVPGGTVLYTFPTPDIIITSTTITLSVYPSESALWTFTGGWYRVKVIHPTDSTQVYRILQGIVQISLD